ncbi:predicted protein [Histoplasma capsulatum H143]|uniref:Uncharacterized protein n=1 Tax=Ajellomyces capsulatus (strain H143) TaxID=544712 RepID=C6HQV4_AJECH|nr:predicted protein [Histoplasma capsulatum H143]
MDAKLLMHWPPGFVPQKPTIQSILRCHNDGASDRMPTLREGGKAVRSVLSLGWMQTNAFELAESGFSLQEQYAIKNVFNKGLINAGDMLTLESRWNDPSEPDIRLIRNEKTNLDRYQGYLKGTNIMKFHRADSLQLRDIREERQITK